MADQKLLNAEDAANYINDLFGLDIGTRWIERQQREGRMAYYKIGGMVRFSTDDLDKLLDNARVEATKPWRLDGTNGEAEAEEVTEDEAEAIEAFKPAPKRKPAAKPASRRRRRTQAS